MRWSYDGRVGGSSNLARTPGFGPGNRGSSPCPPVASVRSGHEHMFVPRTGPRYSEPDARRAVAASTSFTETLRRLGMRPAGGNYATLRRYLQLWSIPTDHFDPDAARRVRRPA